MTLGGMHPAGRGRVLIVAGSDSGGGAGIQADIKTVMALGGYAGTAVSALTAQDTRRVHGVLPVPPAFVQLQMRAVLDDIGADAVKVGMIGDAATIEAVADILEAPAAANLPVVVDPVMVAKGGDRLLADDAVEALRRRLALRADLLTPNLPEAEALTGLSISDIDGMRHAADMLRTYGCRAVLLKGGHLVGTDPADVLATEDGTEVLTAPRIASTHTHGTGCTLSSAIAVSLAQGLSLRDSVLRARAYVRAAIAAAPGLGGGHGPLGHGHTVGPFTAST